VVKILKKIKTLIAIFVVLSLTLTLIQDVTAQASGNMQTFYSREYPGLSIEVNATAETVPGKNMTLRVWINCTAEGVSVDSITISVYGFIYGREKCDLLDSISLMEDKPLTFNHTSQWNHTLNIPNDVWDATYAELYVKYSIMGTPFEYDPNFSITIVRNVYLEELESMLQSLNQTYGLLNQTFWECFQMNLTAENFALLNQTYWELHENYTSLKGSIGGFDTTRTAAIVLSVTTVFFAATTVYLMMRKPKQYW